jgi:hypothetical protein
LGFGLLEVIGEFFVFVSIVHGEFKFAFLGPQNNRLSLHAADHIEGCLGLTAQGHLQEVVLDARLDGLAELRSDLEETVRRAETLNALVRPLVIIVFDPQANALARRLEALELGAGEELLPDRFPEALDLAQGHGVMGPGFEVMGAVLFHLGLEAGGAAPVDELAAVVGEHLLGRLVFAGRHTEDLEHVLGGVTAEQIGGHDEPGVVVHETDEVSIAPAQPEGEDVGLPHLVGSGALEEARAHQVTPGLGRGRDQTLAFEGLAHGLRTGLQEEHPTEQLGDALNSTGRFLSFEFHDLVANRFGQLRPGCSRKMVLESFLAIEPVAARPLVNGGAADPHLLGNSVLSITLLQVEFDDTQAQLKGGRRIFSRRSPPRGGGVLPLLLYLFML